MRRSPVTKRERLRPGLADIMLTIALSKGKMLDLTLDVFRRAGYALGSFSTESRRLVFPCPEIGMTFLIVRPTDVPTYVEYGAADVGIVGKDVLMEQDSDVYEPLDLGFGACRIAVATLKGQASRDRLSSTFAIWVSGRRPGGKTASTKAPRPAPALSPPPKSTGRTLASVGTTPWTRAASSSATPSRSRLMLKRFWKTRDSQAGYRRCTSPTVREGSFLRKLSA